MNNWFVTFSVSKEADTTMMFFVRAHSRASAKYRAMSYLDARYFCEANPKCVINAFTAGKQHPARAEGLVPDFLKGMNNEPIRKQ